MTVVMSPYSSMMTGCGVRDVWPSYLDQLRMSSSEVSSQYLLVSCHPHWHCNWLSHLIPLLGLSLSLSLSPDCITFLKICIAPKEPSIAKKKTKLIWFVYFVHTEIAKNWPESNSCQNHLILIAYRNVLIITWLVQLLMLLWT